MIKKITKDIYKINTDSNIYFLDFEVKTIIDAGIRTYRKDIEKMLKKIVSPDSIKKVLFTHLHYDHIGNFDLFSNAKFYASEDAIKSLKKNKADTILDIQTEDLFNAKLMPLPKRINGLEVIETPGHTRGSVCFWYPKEKVMFCGDTLFRAGKIGRHDLPTSRPEKMEETLEKIESYHYKILCPGHDY